jgi:hypothetical protein
MRTALYLLCFLAILGGADTLYYHEWRARLPSMGRQAQSELELHALRDFVYAVLFTLSRGSHGGELGPLRSQLCYLPK